jgi:hypothetical protein
MRPGGGYVAFTPHGLVVGRFVRFVESEGHSPAGRRRSQGAFFLVTGRFSAMLLPGFHLLGNNFDQSTQLFLI